MSKVRRDNKKRILLPGESQRKDGKYEYKYQDVFGVRRSIYSWKLTETDKSPKGKRDDLSLREKKKQIQKELDSNVAPYGGNLTVLELVKKYVDQKRGVRHNTIVNYQADLNNIAKEKFGQKRIDTVKKSDAKGWFISLQDNGKGWSTIQSIHSVIRAAFQMAVDDDLLNKNPFDFQLKTVIANDSETREAITAKQEQSFLDFIKNDTHYCKYYDGIFILFKTGLRISEFAGLTIKDIDFENNKIIVDHQLQRTSDMQYIIDDPKTGHGTRMIPMTTEVRDCLERIIANRQIPRVEPTIQDYSGFLFLDRNDRPMVAYHWQKVLERICKKYNGIYSNETIKVTPHICRHTFCSNMAKAGMNPVVLQYIMGHSNISITLNTYTHVGYEDAAKEIKKFSGNNLDSVLNQPQNQAS
jgi:site-specific recombinase XerD